MELQDSRMMQIDIYYSSNNIDSLRWLSEVKNEIKRYQTSIKCNYHDICSNYSRNNGIKSDFITLNGKRIIFQQLRSILKSNY